MEGEIPVDHSFLKTRNATLQSRVVWDCNFNDKELVKFLRLNNRKIPIVHKYCEGKVKRTLKKEWKEHKIATNELDSTCFNPSGYLEPSDVSLYIAFEFPITSICDLIGRKVIRL